MPRLGYKPGECIIIETGRGGEPDAHLFIVVTDGDKPNDVIILLPVCTIRGGYYDSTTELEAGSHDFIHRRSYINYYEAKIITVDSLDNLLRQGIARMRRPDIDADILEKVCAGIIQSFDSPGKLINEYNNYCYRNEN